MPSLLRLARPKQWAKNALVFSAPGAAGILHEPTVLWRAVLAFLCFCLAASGTYYLNDSSDAAADRLHPQKKHRPVASGVVSERTARTLGYVLLCLSVSLGLLAGTWHLPVVVAGYVALTTLYTFALKHQPVLDLAAIAAGFVLRALAGAAATDVPTSEWFILVTTFGSLFMIAGKRAAELAAMEDAGGHKVVLAHYSPQYLTFVRSVAASVTLLSYALWAFSEGDGTTAFWYQLSLAPFTVGVLRYALRLDSGGGGAPEDVVLGDRTLIVVGAVWAATFAMGVYA